MPAPTPRADDHRPPTGGRTRSLGFRLTLLLAALLLALGSLSAWLYSRQLGALLLDGARSEALRLADTVKRTTRFDMLNMRWQDLQETIRAVGRQPDIEHVRIYNKEGKIAYSSAPAEVTQVVDMTAEACYQCHAAAQPLTHLDSPQRARIFAKPGDTRVLAAIDVIYNEPSCSTAECHVHPERHSVLGVVDVGVSLRAIDERIASAGHRALGVGLLVTVLVCGLIGLFVYAFVSRPVRRLVAGTRRVAQGDLDSTLRVTSGDELGHLASSFNQMTADLRRARNELKAWADTLEQQVEEKTKALQLAQSQILRAEKLSSIGVLAAGVAHELNSPLTGILTFAHMLLQDSPPGSQQREDLQLIVNETNRCAAIIRQLLDFARESAPQKKPQDLVQVLRRALALVEHQALFHNIRIDCQLADGLPAVSCDGNQMEQVFLNLLINAAEAMPKGGSIRIQGRAEPPGQLTLAIEDTGVGIAPENLGRIFDPFYTSKQVGKGTGLGLAVTYGIVRRHGGSIAVQSKPGAGTRFTIVLPAAAEERVAP